MRSPSRATRCERRGARDRSPTLINAPWGRGLLEVLVVEHTAERFDVIVVQRALMRRPTSSTTTTGSTAA